MTERRMAHAPTHRVKALTFDTGGTMLDWFGGISGVLRDRGTARGIDADWQAVTNEYRQRAVAAMLEGPPDSVNIDAVHRIELESVITDFGLERLGHDDREQILARWHELDCWPDVRGGFDRLRRGFVVASFTILSVALVIDVSRRNGLLWDAIISGEMNGLYKIRPEAYLTTARLLGLEPQEIMMVACHNHDLDAARACGFRSAFVYRREEWGPGGPADREAHPHHDVIVEDFDGLAGALVSWSAEDPR